MKIDPKSAGQVACFRARFHHARRGYVTVRVFRSRATMYRYANANRFGARLGRSYYGLATTWRKSTLEKKRWRTQPEHGEILFCVGHLGAEVVSHECAHMMFGYVARRRLKVDRLPGGTVTLDEEQACHALGGLVSHVVAGLRRHKLIAVTEEARG